MRRIYHGRYRYRPVVRDQGNARLTNVNPEAEPINNVAIAGFARPLPEKDSDSVTINDDHGTSE